MARVRTVATVGAVARVWAVTRVRQWLRLGQ